MGNAWASWLRTHREAAGLTRQELAERAGVGRVTVWRWETGASKPEQAEVVQRVAEALGSPGTRAMVAAGFMPDTRMPALFGESMPVDPNVEWLLSRLTHPATPDGERETIRIFLEGLRHTIERQTDEEAAS